MFLFVAARQMQCSLDAWWVLTIKLHKKVLPPILSIVWHQIHFFLCHVQHLRLNLVIQIEPVDLIFVFFPCWQGWVCVSEGYNQVWVVNLKDTVRKLRNSSPTSHDQQSRKAFFSCAVVYLLPGVIIAFFARREIIF